MTESKRSSLAEESAEHETGESTYSEGLGSGQRRYWTPLIADRRKRILIETRNLITDVGADGFTLRDLGQRAGVSVTTIYNIFGDKAGVITHALQEFHAGIELQLPREARCLQGFVEAISHTTRIVIENRGYALALADLYFSRSLAPALFEVIRGMPLQVFTPWLEMAARDGELHEGSDPAAICATFANLEWASIKDWGAGRVADGDLEAIRHRSFLQVVIASTRDPLRCAATELFAQSAG
jgi:AcrR family transcriptional regulator